MRLCLYVKGVETIIGVSNYQSKLLWLLLHLINKPGLSCADLCGNLTTTLIEFRGAGRLGHSQIPPSEPESGVGRIVRNLQRRIGGFLVSLIFAS
jgi:hypothetical protein